MKWPLGRRGTQVLVVVAVVLGALLSRVFVDGRAALADGDAAARRAQAAAAAGDQDLAIHEHEEAVSRWRRAARWYAPGAPHVGAAYGRLVALAQAAEAGGDRELSLMAWRAVRSSALATRSFYTPHAGDLGRANVEIARLMAALEGPDADPGQSEEARRAWHLGLLERNEAPSVGWSLLAVLGFLTWVGGGFWFAFRGLTAEDRLDRRQATTSGVLVAAGLAVWMVSLYLA